MTGSYCLLKLRNQQAAAPTRPGTTSLAERMSVKMNEMFFGRSASSAAINSSLKSAASCKPLNCLSSKSIRSNLACNNKRVSQSDLIADIIKFAQIESGSNAATFLKSSVPEKCFLQCSLCFTLLNDHPDELKMHIVKTHVYNQLLNKCMVCCYCR